MRNWEVCDKDYKKLRNADMTHEFFFKNTAAAIAIYIYYIDIHIRTRQA